MGTVVFCHAHPDDEVMITGGTMARLSAEGHRVVLVTATGGELGERPDGALGEGESLADLRARELARSCRELGVTRQVFLGFHDSGMAGEPSNDSPSSFWQADLDEAAQRLADVLVEESPDAVTIYDEHGNYGHPDHVQVHRVGLRAARKAGIDRVFMATVNRDRARSMMGEADAQTFDPGEERAALLETLGVEEARITTAVDVSGYVEAKRRAIAAHASQVSDTSFFLSMPPEIFALAFGTEWYVRVGATPGQPWETSLLPG